MSLFLYNTLSRKKEEFKPIGSPVGLYTCGPTVYHYQHLGNLRTYVFEDLLKRTLRYNDYEVKHVMNVTDVGHLVGDGDEGEDKMEVGSAREGKTAYEIADFYFTHLKNDLKKLNILPPDIWCKATDYISEQIELIKTLEEKGYTYRTSDGIYFETSKFSDYTKLSHLNLDELKEGARVEKNPEKHSPTDFALWKFSPTGVKRQMEWDSPWGVGFPGWHIECSAMSLHFLKGHLDIHCGAVDHINTHHTNEIAQSEAASGKPFFNFWLHGAFLNLEGEKMSKSKGHIITITSETESGNIEPLAFRYTCLLTHYRKPMTYKPEILEQAQAGLTNLRKSVSQIREEAGEVNSEYAVKFETAINDDLNFPQALAVLQELLKSEVGDGSKRATIEKFETVLALDLFKATDRQEVPSEIRQLASEREKARQEEDWVTADAMRDKIEKLGYRLQDSEAGVRIVKK